MEAVEILQRENERLLRLVRRHAAELNRRRGEMSVARDALAELGETEGTFYERVNRLGVYKRALESMAAQMIHPKRTAIELAMAQLSSLGNTDNTKGGE